MGFWIFMFLMTLWIPLTMIGFGRYFQKKAPKEINAAFGYRTKRSMKNREYLRKYITATFHSCHAVRNWKIRRYNWNSRRDSLCDPDDFSGGTDLADGKGAEEYV